MNRKTIFITSLALITSGFTLCQQPNSLIDRFNRIDRNSDGKVTPEELPRAELFKRFDRNKDGVITKDDLGRLGTGRENDPDLRLPDEPEHTKHYDIVYKEVEGVDPNLLSLDFYTPKVNPEGSKRPVVIMIHGGGWRGGDKRNSTIASAKMRHFVGKGYIYVSINYRLSPTDPAKPNGVKHPVHASDCAAAIAWVHNRIGEHGGDPDQMHLMGHSAGAHLAAIVATDHRLLAAHDKPLSILKTNVLLDTAAIDIVGYLEKVGSGGMRQLYENAFGKTDGEMRDASPLSHVASDKDIPPTLLFYGGNRMHLDVFAGKFARAMTEAGAPTQAIDTVDLDHRQINAHIGMIGDPMTGLIMKLHAGEDPTAFPGVLPGKEKKTAVNPIQWTRDYLAGSYDEAGNYMGGTETMRILAHEGKLYAGLSYWTDQPGEDPRPGGQILVKDGQDKPWRVSRSFAGCGRISAMESFRFSNQQSILFADAAPVSSRQSGELVCYLLDNETGGWVKSVISSDAPRAFLRAFGQLGDRVFAGTGAGEIYSGKYRADNPGNIEWNPEPEYQNPDFDGGSFRRCQGFCVANGRLYASVAPRLLERQPDAGWKEVFRWTPQDRAGAGLRGITAVPAFDGDREVIIGSREQEGRILRIDPERNFQVTVELDSREFIRSIHPGFRGGKLVAYNKLIPGKHPASGESMHWFSVAGGISESRQAAWLLMRTAGNGKYEIVKVEDPAVPDVYLVSTRTFAYAPWNPSEFYTGGYDGAANQRRNHNSAWIYRGVMIP